MKSKLMRAATLLMVLTLMTSCFVGSTFAKYTSTATGNDTATVAKWSIEVNDAQIALADTQNDAVTFNLFDTINEEDTTSEEDDVKDTLIAPGTGGQFNLKVENLSEVTADYEITLAHENTSNIPLEYKLADGSWSSDIDSLIINGDELAMENGTATKTVYWRWQYNDVAGLKDDSTDTKLGIAAQTAAPTVKVTATIKVWQVD